MTNVNLLFAVDTNGYIGISREALFHLLSQIEHPSNEAIYAYLLAKASYTDGWISHGKILNRGYLEINHEEFMKLTKSKESGMYNILNRLIRLGLLERVEKGKNIYRLPFYDLHCGGNYQSTSNNRMMRRRLQYTKTESDDFKEFFEFYHFALDIPPSERIKTWQVWQTLTDEEKELAMCNVTQYAESLRKPEHAKLACNYLKDKSFIF